MPNSHIVTANPNIIYSEEHTNFMKAKAYPDGVSDFKALVTGNYYFVDKTSMIRDLCGSKDRTFLFTRPRRFGKSINLSMLDYFFNIEYSGEPDIFKGLMISSCESCDKYRNAYPVIRLNFGKLRGESKEKFVKSLVLIINVLFDHFISVLDDGSLRTEDHDTLRRFIRPDIDEVEASGAVGVLCHILKKNYGVGAILLVDEYDHCMQNIKSSEEFDSIVAVLRPFMEQSFKFNDNCEFAVVTGIMPLAKTSMLSGFNNASIHSILNSEGDEYFGFTEEEVSGLMSEMDIPIEKISEIREWYDGYHFGNADVYNPYSVMMYLSNGCATEAYWNNMTGGGLSNTLLSNLGAEALIELKGLREKMNSCILSPISTRIAYPDVLTPTAEPYAVYSYLAMAGYLNAVKTGKTEGGMPVCKISMVNEEVSIAFDSLAERAAEVESIAARAIDSIYDKNPAMLKKYLESMLSGLALDRNWSQDENPTSRHNRYRDVIMAYLVTPDLIAKEEMPKGYGYADIFFEKTESHPPVVMEIKTTMDRSCDLPSLACDAVRQIDMRCYAEEPGMDDAVLVGVAIRGKTVEVRFGRSDPAASWRGSARISRVPDAEGSPKGL